MKQLAMLVTCLLFVLGALEGAKADGVPRWSDEILYFVLIDRFADGDATNNARIERRNPGGYHGGDLKGLMSQLDELADLGVTALWINPVQKQMAQGMYARAPGKLGIADFMHWGFHGYWIDDFKAMEPQFGTREDLKVLVDAAHARGIKVLLDVVYNHSGYDSPYKTRVTANGEPWMRLGEGNCEVNPVTCAVGGLPDFRTELPEVRAYLLEANIELAKYAGVEVSASIPTSTWTVIFGVNTGRGRVPISGAIFSCLPNTGGGRPLRLMSFSRAMRSMPASISVSREAARRSS